MRKENGGKNYPLIIVCSCVALLLLAFAVDWFHALYMATDSTTTWNGVSVASGVATYWFPWGAISKDRIILFFAIALFLSLIGELTRSIGNSNPNSNPNSKSTEQEERYD